MDGAANAEGGGSLRGEFSGTAATVHGAAGWRMNGHMRLAVEEFGLPGAPIRAAAHSFLPIVDGKNDPQSAAANHVADWMS
ncbi:MAG: hypothetical protein R3F36_03690 [Candidatus Competibacteraceae bacterium]